MKLKINDIVKNNVKNSFRVLYLDKRGVFLESIDKKLKIYESVKDLNSKYVFSSRDTLDLDGNQLSTGDWIKDPTGKIVQIKEAKNGSITTDLDQVYESTDCSLQTKVNRESLLQKGYREILLGKDRIKFFDYQTLNDAIVYHTGFKKGSTDIFYLTDSIKTGFYERNDPRSVDDINEDYVYIGSIDEVDFDVIKNMFREDVFTPNGEAKKLYESLGIDHFELKTGDMLRIEDKLFVITRQGIRTINESNISKKELHRDLREDHTQDVSKTYCISKNPKIQVGDWVKYGVRDVANNMKWYGQGRAVKVSKDTVLVWTEIGRKEEYPLNCVEAIPYLNN